MVVQIYGSLDTCLADVTFQRQPAAGKTVKQCVGVTRYECCAIVCTADVHGTAKGLALNKGCPEWRTLSQATICGTGKQSGADPLGLLRLRRDTPVPRLVLRNGEVREEY